MNGQEQPATPIAPPKGRILIAEDQVVNQKLLQYMLRQFGYASDIAETGAEAIAALERQEYVLIFMDVQMPEMDGLEASRRINSEWKDRPRPKIIAVTAETRDGDRERCLEAGMDDYMTKPIQMDVLRAMLDRWAPAMPEAPPVAVPGGLSLEELEEPMQTRLRKLGAEKKPSLVLELLESYLNMLPAHNRQMRAIIESGSLNEIELLAHSLKGSGRNLGLEQLGSVAARMEEAAEKADIRSVRSMLPDFTRAMEQATASLRRAIEVLRRGSG